MLVAHVHWHHGGACVNAPGDRYAQVMMNPRFL